MNNYTFELYMQLIFKFLIVALFIGICSCNKERTEFVEPESKLLSLQKDSLGTFFQPLFSDTMVEATFLNGTGTQDGMFILSYHVSKEELLDNNTSNLNYKLHYITEYGVRRIEKKRTMKVAHWEFPLTFKNGSIGYFYYPNNGELLFRYLSDEAIVYDEIELGLQVKDVLNIDDYNFVDVISTSNNGFLCIFLNFDSWDKEYFLVQCSSTGEVINSISLGDLNRSEYIDLAEIANKRFVMVAGNQVYLYDEDLNTINLDTIEYDHNWNNQLSGNSDNGHFFVGNKIYNNNGELESEISANMYFLNRSLLTNDGGLLVYGKIQQASLNNEFEIAKFTKFGDVEWRITRLREDMRNCLFMSQLPSGDFMGVMSDLDHRFYGSLSVFRMTRDGRLP